MLSVPIYNKEGKEIDQVAVPQEIFGAEVNTEVLHQAMVMYQAALRQGNASTKERGAVSGGGKKPWRQKGTGRARAGSSRSPLWKGGGVVFGPHPRDFGYTVAKRIRRIALRESLNAKFHSKNMICLEDLKGKLEKTRDFAKVLTALKLQGKILALLDGCDASVRLVSRNIPRFELVRSEDVNAYDVLRNKNLLLTRQSLLKILERVK